MRKHLDLFILFGVIVAIKIFSLFPLAVEQYYSNGIYPVIARVQRILLGWIPFSMGDFLYAGVTVYLVWSIVKVAWNWRKRPITMERLWVRVKKILRFAMIVYIWFNISWGLNYNRVGIADQLGLKVEEISKEDLTDLAQYLADSLNVLAPKIYPDYNKVERKRVLFQGAVGAYKNLEKRNENFGYTWPSVKPSLYSYLGNYMGFTGYYNPFTGEAQVNTTVPNFIRPFTTCHEIGHSLGYAKEYEANLSAFLSASVSDDPVFRYSVYFEMYAYTRPYLYMEDSMALKKIDSTIHPQVKKDYREMREFFAQYKTPVEAMVDLFYSNYLKLNEQPMGRRSYNEVVYLLVAWRKARQNARRAG
jgi:hypothetical protein